MPHILTLEGCLWVSMKFLYFLHFPTCLQISTDRASDRDLVLSYESSETGFYPNIGYWTRFVITVLDITWVLSLSSLTCYISSWWRFHTVVVLEIQ